MPVIRFRLLTIEMKNKFVFIFTLLAFSTLVVAATFPAGSSAGTTGLGKQLKIYEENGTPKFGVQIMHNSNPDPERMWAITFSIQGAELSAGKPLRVIAWRLWDQRSETFLSEWRTQVESVNDRYYPGVAAFSWDTAVPSVVFEAIQNSTQLALVISATHQSRPNQPTHFIDLGAYCSSAANHFLNLTTGQSGCGTLTKPVQPVQLPPVQKKVNEVLWIADRYCAAVSQLDQDFAKIAGTGAGAGSGAGSGGTGLPLGVPGQMRKELKLARVVCSSKTNEFVGFKEIKDANTRAIVNMAAATAGFSRLSLMARETSPALYGWILSNMMSFERDQKIVFNDSLYAAYPDLNSSQSWKIHHAITSWAVDLSNYYRNQ